MSMHELHGAHLGLWRGLDPGQVEAVVAMGHEVLLQLREAGAVTGARRDPGRPL